MNGEGTKMEENEEGREERARKEDAVKDVEEVKKAQEANVYMHLHMKK